MCPSISTRKTIICRSLMPTIVIYWITLSVLYAGITLGDSISQDTNLALEEVNNIFRHFFPMVSDKSRSPLRDNMIGLQLLMNDHHNPNHHLSSSSNFLTSSSSRIHGGETDGEGGGGGGGGESSVKGELVGVNSNSDNRGLSTEDLIAPDSQSNMYPYHHQQQHIASRNIGIESRSPPVPRDSLLQSSSVNNLLNKLVASERIREAAETEAVAGYSGISLADLPSSSSHFSSLSSNPDFSGKATESLLSSLPSSLSSQSSPLSSPTSSGSSPALPPLPSSSTSYINPSDIKIVTSRTPSGLNGRVLTRNPSHLPTSNHHSQQLVKHRPNGKRLSGLQRCMKRCIAQGNLHPVQCHSLC